MPCIRSKTSKYGADEATWARQGSGFSRRSQFSASAENEVSHSSVTNANQFSKWQWKT